VVRAQLVAALLCGGIISLAASAQQKHNDGVRISCPLLLHSHPIKIVRPTYPELARQTHIQGRVSLKCLVGLDGLVEKIEVKKGHPLLIQSAMDAVSQWKFKPPLLNGKRVEMETTVSIDFQLPKEQQNTSSTKPHPD
jgi:protein TonB